MANKDGKFGSSGPLTLGEIQLIQKPLELIKRRVTIEVSEPSRTIYDESPEVDFLIRMQQKEFKEEEELLNPTFITEYQNSSKQISLSPEEHSHFIQQLSDVLQISDSPVKVKSERESQNRPVIFLNDNPIIISDEESLDNSVLEELELDSPICIDDKDDEVQVCMPTSPYTLNDDKFEKSVANEACNSGTASFDRLSDSLNEKTSTSMVGPECCSYNNEDSTLSESIDVDRALNTSPDSEHNEITPFERSKDESTENLFNDTLEEIERALKYGFDYDNVVQTNIQDHQQQDNKSTENLEFSPSPPIVNSQQKRTPLQKLTPKVIKPEFNFKQPLHKPKSAKKKTPNFKDVVSPVGVYIKNSPRCPILRNIPALEKKILFHTQDQPVIPKCNENVLPTVVYKPARKVITTTEPHLKLPSNIKKLLPLTPTIIRHEGRCGQKSEPQMSETFLSNNVSIDKSLLDSTIPLEEISLHHNKEAYIS